MKVKRFLAQDMRRALARIREEMGADAVILSNRTLDEGVEVVAASLTDQPEAPSTISAAKSPTGKSASGNSTEDYAAAIQAAVDRSHRGRASADLTSSERTSSERNSSERNSSERIRDERAAAEKNSPQTQAQRPLTDADGSRSTASLSGVAAFEFGRLQREAQHNASTPYLKTTKDQQIRLSDSRRPAADESYRAAEEREARAAAASQFEQFSQQAEGAEQREMTVMRAELNGIRRLLEQRLSGLAWDQFARRNPAQATVWERLNAMGVPAALSRSLLESLKPDLSAAEAWRFAIASLSRRVPVLGTDIAARGGVYALLGPTGVGKTTTIGKLATRCVLEHGSDAVALVTTDSYRVAAHEQLRTFGRILDVSVRVVDETHSLRQILDSLQHKRLVLIDTAGLHQKDPGLLSQLQMLRECREVRKLLVLACTSQAGVLANACKTYAPAELSGCILSKLDEAGTIGEALALTIDLKLPVVYETHGQGIPDDMRVAQAHNLVSKAVALSVHSADEKERLIYEFGGAVADVTGITEGGALAAENFDGSLRAAQRSGR
ncbi:MAG: flagellar biosynthesis protein FlhF [Gammaproteobacteria bacterium]|nr:flagellar biosynthesis protein FlhF [Gammaproteobacteria bacterium]